MNHGTPMELARGATAIHPAGAWILLLRWRKRRAAVTSAGPYAGLNPLRFSSRWWDDAKCRRGQLLILDIPPHARQVCRAWPDRFEWSVRVRSIPSGARGNERRGASGPAS